MHADGAGAAEVRAASRRPLWSLAYGAVSVSLLSIALLWSWHTLWVVAGAASGVWMLSGLRGTPARQAIKTHGTLVVGAPFAVILKLLYAPDLAALILVPYGAVVLLLYGLVRSDTRGPQRNRLRSGVAIVAWAVGAALTARMTWPWPGSESSSVAPSGGVLVCLGDSLTSGLHADKSGTYPQFLAEKTEWRVVNAGVANDTVADALARLERDVLAHRPAAVLVMIGGNDFMYGTPRDDFERRLDELASRIAASSSRLILVEVPSGLVADRFVGAYRRVARRHQVPLIPDTVLRARFLSGLVLDRLRPEKDRETIDGIHLTHVGQRRLAAALVPYLRSSILVR